LQTTGRLDIARECMAKLHTLWSSLDLHSPWFGQ